MPFLTYVVVCWCAGQVAGMASFSVGNYAFWIINVGAFAAALLSRSFLLLGLSSVFVAGFASTQSLNPRPIPRIEQPHFIVFGEVDEEPRSPRVGERRVSLLVHGVREGDTQLISRRILCTTHDLPWRNGSRLRVGDLAWFHGQLRPDSRVRFGEEIWGYRGYLLRRGVRDQCRLLYVGRSVGNQSGTIDRIRSSLKERVISVLGPTERAGLILSLLFGFRDTLSDDLERRLEAVSLSHLLVVSGYQVSMMFVTLRLLLSVGAPRRWRLVRDGGAILGTWGYVSVVGWEPSAVRAAVAMTVYVLSEMLGNRRAMGRSILLSLLVVTAIWPGCFFEMGVQLTFAALTAIAVSAKLFRRCSSVTQAVCTPCAVTVATMMISAAWGYAPSVFGLFLNPVVVPFVSLFGGPLSAAGVALTYTPLDESGQILGALADILISVLVWIADWCEFPSERQDPAVVWRAIAGLILVSLSGLIVRRWCRRAIPLRGAV